MVDLIDDAAPATTMPPTRAVSPATPRLASTVNQTPPRKNGATKSPHPTDGLDEDSLADVVQARLEEALAVLEQAIENPIDLQFDADDVDDARPPAATSETAATRPPSERRPTSKPIEPDVLRWALTTPRSLKRTRRAAPPAETAAPETEPVAADESESLRMPVEMISGATLADDDDSLLAPLAPSEPPVTEASATFVSPAQLDEQVAAFVSEQEDLAAEREALQRETAEAELARDDARRAAETIQRRIAEEQANLEVAWSELRTAQQALTENRQNLDHERLAWETELAAQREALLADRQAAEEDLRAAQKLRDGIQKQIESERQVMLAELDSQRLQIEHLRHDTERECGRLRDEATRIHEAAVTRMDVLDTYAAQLTEREAEIEKRRRVLDHNHQARQNKLREQQDALRQRDLEFAKRETRTAQQASLLLRLSRDAIQARGVPRGEQARAALVALAKSLARSIPLDQDAADVTPASPQTPHVPPPPTPPANPTASAAERQRTAAAVAAATVAAVRH